MAGAELDRFLEELSHYKTENEKLIISIFEKDAALVAMTRWVLEMKSIVTFEAEKEFWKKEMQSYFHS